MKVEKIKKISGILYHKNSKIYNIVGDSDSNLITEDNEIIPKDSIDYYQFMRFEDVYDENDGIVMTSEQCRDFMMPIIQCSGSHDVEMWLKKPLKDFISTMSNNSVSIKLNYKKNNNGEK